MGLHDEAPNYPDGLDEAAIELLISEVAGDMGVAPALLGGGPAIKRSRRRIARRTLGGTVRVLRVHGHASVTGRTEAA